MKMDIITLVSTIPAVQGMVFHPISQEGPKALWRTDLPNVPVNDQITLITQVKKLANVDIDQVDITIEYPIYLLPQGAPAGAKQLRVVEKRRETRFLNTVATNAQTLLVDQIMSAVKTQPIVLDLSNRRWVY